VGPNVAQDDHLIYASDFRKGQERFATRFSEPVTLPEPKPPAASQFHSPMKNSLQFLHSEAGRCAELEIGAEEISCFETRSDRLASRYTPGNKDVMRGI
jgi:hypothetical protein